MNYRGRQVKLMWERDIARREQNWTQERQQFQQDILNLQNSTEAKIIEQLEQEVKKKQTLLNDTIALLGKEDINTLNDLQTLLEGKTLKNLIQQKEKTIISLNNSYNKLETKTKSEIDKLKQLLQEKANKIKELLETEKTVDQLIKGLQEFNQEID